MARLRQQEKLLMGQLQRQELHLHRLQLNQGWSSSNTVKARVDQSQDVTYAGQGGLGLRTNNM